MAEVRPAGPIGARQLIAVRCEVQIEREDLPFRQPVLEPKCQHRLADLDADAAPAAPILARQKELRSLLGDRRAALDPPAATYIPHGGSHDRDRIDAWMSEEAPVFSCNRRINECRWQ